MKPVIVNMKDLSDSTEVYETKPKRFTVYTIYVITIILVVAVLWMSLSKLEIVVKSNGIFRCDEPIYEVSGEIAGKIESCNVTDGQFVNAGDTLLTIKVENLEETIKSYQNELKKCNQRLEMLEVYEKSLDDGSSVLDPYSDNLYYQEFVDKRKLLFVNIDAFGQNTKGEVEIYQQNVDMISDAIEQYENKKEKYEQAKDCIIKRKNTFKKADSYYCSMVDSYISNYNLTASQYDIQIAEYQEQVDKYNKLLKDVKNQKTNENELSSDELKKERDNAEEKVGLLKSEKKQTLSNLELQQISSIEQQIDSIKETITSQEANLKSAELQLQTANDTDVEQTKEIQILTEKGNIAAERLSYQSKVEEYENYLKNYDVQNNQCKVTAKESGYFYFKQDVKQGSYMQEGITIGSIYPDKTDEYYAEIYVENADIAKLQEGQEVKFEIAAYPSSEYGYFTGKIDNIAKDITVDESTGSAYYLVKVACDTTSVCDKDGEQGNIMNGMACQARIVVDEQNVLQYLLRKIDLID